MSYMHPAALAARHKYWTRQDAHRFAPPVPPKSFAARRIEQRKAEEDEIARAVTIEEYEVERLKLRRALAELKFELAWRRLCRKYGYNPNQPRVPSGNPDGGQWTDVGGTSGSGRNDLRVISDAVQDSPKPGAQYAQYRASVRPLLLNGQWQVPTARQDALLGVLEGRSQAATQKVQTVLPSWRAPESV